MDRNEQTMIRDLFGKLSQAEQTAPPRDPEADRFIRESVESQPGAPYYMAQTIIVQEQALEAAKARIDELERQGSRPFGGLFGNRSRSSSPRPWGNPDDGRSSAAGMGAGAGGYGRPAAGSAARGGGFLAGAAQTAMGVAGGMMLGSMLGGMFAGDEAAAGEMDAGAGDMGAEEMAADETADFGGDFEDI
ncbi:DUF2076 domain-containing protein [Fulvimarina sp. 2208YS6-2-32]|uniref:DUF2076 domain-containing protein n=1 Tax=Fulvimarina uroteuthidis TaxID=3098149 RepID=A0ABU5I057_9HYPH|nr:DUF2076 domain-containing protein [Fulvimarina sp. 2208YS6-2-32]MDY8108764.1 DUF2076 domain-containing protein [Fulvimarina sp. 2208YS6-2-32]